MSIPALRLYVGTTDSEQVGESESIDDRPSPDWTLIDFYLRHVKRRCLKRRSPKTWKQYEIALWRWWQATTGWTEEQLLSAVDQGFSVHQEPRLYEITDDVCQDFVETMEEMGTSQATLHKWAVHLNYCLLRAGPRVGSKRHFARLVDDPGLIDAPPVEASGAKPGYTLDEIGRLIDVLQQSAKPLPAIRRWNPRIWWPALATFVYNTGARPETLFQLQWDHFSEDDQHREADGSMHVLKIPARILKGHRHPQTIWLNHAAYRAIQPLRRPSGRIFDWPWPTAETSLGTALSGYLDLAGIPHGRDKNLPYGWYGFRRAFSRECMAIKDVSGKLIPGATIAAALMLNHRIPGLTILLQHYTTGVNLLREVLPYLPQPGPSHQGTLFDV